ncbi:BTB/POZ domain-containing protein KCTD6-like [Physella acuta]|uniref:BTB/POZ domain-containing protein KCTD6-like n=1 Tax=Physella acuta TaxID=109671 RepID=UPI0027DEA632|nr:BTB/POZ domain-containing protein KCTD6-like [Physella acuta]XP_059150668.1 BTB/POZ domain-containing protein KCTD6-like [Physella acuta]XP_059150670.1 BTB/POZ domain-containing protein KCTD6-like [Physella acuta]XP_059150671.1 BTB/POZ domain-containing protein KCTD6-like [Physella acuta]XP_059150672.1 BTB/POZ domain-containing protein KCTD6-like [Physella acuta]
MSKSVLTLNVGGVLYTTTTATLLKFPESMLGSLLGRGMPSTKDANGHLFIDRDGHTFRHILNFLRCSQLCLPANFKELDLLSAEADFYQISPLIDAINDLRDKRKGHTFYLEIIEVRTGSTATMPTCNSRVKTILLGRTDILLTLPPVVIGSDSSERLSCKEPYEYTELELFGSPVRLRVGEELHNLGWTLISSDLSTSSGFDNKSQIGMSLIIEHTFRDRWCREFAPDEPIKINPNHTMLLEDANV